jgi:hypothetical protein
VLRLNALLPAAFWLLQHCSGRDTAGALFGQQQQQQQQQAAAGSSSSLSSSSALLGHVLGRLQQLQQLPPPPALCLLLLLLLAFWAGLHFPFLARAFSPLSASVSFKGAGAGCSGVTTPASPSTASASATGMAIKGSLISCAVLLHCAWALSASSGAPAKQALLAQAAGAACFWLLCWAVRGRFYTHLHHWLCGLLLLPLSSCHSLQLSAALAGFCLSQLVEGAARWSLAPPWHER